MKKVNYIIYLLVVLVFINCGSDDDGPREVELEAQDISFANIDGTSVADSSCLELAKNYQVVIKTVAKGDGELIPTRIDYSLNGVTYSKTIVIEGLTYIPIEINEGQNTIQLLSNGISKTAYAAALGEYELVP